MSEYMFGLTHGKLPRGIAKVFDKIAHRHGAGCGFTEIYDPGQGWKGWFAGPNKGEPVDFELATAVLRDVEAEAPDVYRKQWG